MNKNKKWLSLIIAIWLTLVMSLLVYYILEYIIPFWKNTKNIEHSINAYYQADSWIEDALYSMKTNVLWYEKTKNLSQVIDYSIEMKAMWNTMPPAWEWNSEFDNNWNIIKIWEPIQIEVWNWVLNNLKIYFRVPDLNNDWLHNETLAWWGSLKVVNWQLTAEDNTLNAENSHITWSQINWNDIWIFSRNWKTLDEVVTTFSNFYSSNCWWWKQCKLKMSILTNLKLSINNSSVPYLEWKIENDTSIPLRYAIIKTSWKSYGFRKFLRVKIPQQTIWEAFDFTVFQ